MNECLGWLFSESLNAVKTPDVLQLVNGLTEWSAHDDYYSTVEHEGLLINSGNRTAWRNPLGVSLSDGSQTLMIVDYQSIYVIF